MTRAQLRQAGIGIFALVAAAAAANIWLVPRWAWPATAAAIVAGFVVLGLASNGRAAGILIDGRNRISLSRFQACCWTVLVLSSVTTTAAWNLHAGQSTALDFAIPQQLLAAMGIALASLTATPTVLAIKSGGAAAGQPQQLATATSALTPQGSAGTVVASGSVVARTDSADASWLDLFRGDEVGNAASPDVSKVQKFLVTAMLVGIYSAALWKAFAAPAGPFAGLPPLSSDFVWLLGVSHAGYLIYKSAPHTPPAG